MKLANINELAEAVGYQNLPKVESVKFLWDWDYYDGPLSGVCETCDGRCFFHMVDATDDGTRRYVLIKPTQEQLSRAEELNLLFQEKVGGGCDEKGH